MLFLRYFTRSSIVRSVLSYKYSQAQKLSSISVSSLIVPITTFDHKKFMMTDSNKSSIATYEEVLALKDKPDILLIDVREPEELQETGAIPTSINIPLGSLAEVLAKMDPADFKTKYLREKPTPDTEIVFHCKMGGRAGKAMDLAKSLGFIHARNYLGSWKEWESKQQNVSG